MPHMGTGKLRINMGANEGKEQEALELVLAPVAVLEPEHDPVVAELERDPVAAKQELARVEGELELSPAEALELDRVAVELAHALAAVAPVTNRSVIAAHHHAQVPVPKRAADLVAAVGGITRDPAAIEAAAAWAAAE